MLSALCSAYMKVAIESASEKFAIDEYKHYGKALRFLSENVRMSTNVESILKIVWLLVHHQVVNKDSSDNHEWVLHTRLLGILQSKGL